MIFAMHKASPLEVENTTATEHNLLNDNQTIIDTKRLFLKKCNEKYKLLDYRENITNPFIFDNQISNNALSELFINDIQCDLVKKTFLSDKICSEMLKTFAKDYNFNITEDLNKFLDFLYDCNSRRYNKCNPFGDARIEAKHMCTDRIFVEHVCNCQTNGLKLFCDTFNDLNKSALKLMTDISLHAKEKFAGTDLKILQDIQCDLFQFFNELFKQNSRCSNVGTEIFTNYLTVHAINNETITMLALND